MSQYILVMGWFAVIYLLSQFVSIYEFVNVNGKKKLRVQMIFAVLVVLPLIWWTAVRSVSIGDTGYYAMAFRSLPTSFSELPSYLVGIEKDKGFYVLGFFLKLVARNNVTVYFFLLAAIQMLCIMVTFRKYSTNYIMAIFLFVATTDYLSWMHNGIRQFTAVVLIFATTELMLQRRYVPLIAVILLASTIHGSALLMIPIVFVVQGKPWNKKTVLAIIAFVVAIVFVDNFTGVLETLLEDTQYTNVVSDWQSWNDDGTNPLRVLVYSIPTILSLIGLKYVKAAKDPVIDLACNMGILSTMLYCLSMVTSGIFIGRLPIYCSMYATGILLPWEVEHMFTKESAKLVKLALVGGFTMFYIFHVHFAWGWV